MDRSDRAQHRVEYQALTNTVMNLSAYLDLLGDHQPSKEKESAQCSYVNFNSAGWFKGNAVDIHIRNVLGSNLSQGTGYTD
jgi:hypothetical protein